jgi:iron complex transport system substrate-binding protein
MNQTRHTRRRFVAGTAGTLAGIGFARSIGAQSTPFPVASPAAGGTRLVRHAMGETEVPVAPQRIVVLDGPPLDACFLFGIIPVGATTGVADAPMPEYLGEGTKDIVNVGEIAEPNLERIVELQPDLIISLKVRHEEIYPQLSEIAPTVFSEATAKGWRDSFIVFADALNRNDQVEAVVSAFDARCVDIATQLGDALDETTVSIVRVHGEEIRSYQTGSFSGSVMEFIGLPRPEAQSNPDESWIALSAEQFQAIDASAMFITSWGDQAAADFSGLAGNPLWGTLEVVRNNRVFFVPDEYWMTAIGYFAAGLILDDVTAYLIEGKPAPPLPGVQE